MERLLDYTKAADEVEAFKIVRENMTDDYLSQFHIEHEISYDDKKRTMIASGRGFTLTVIFKEEWVECELDMSFLLKPFKRKVLNALKGQLEQVI